MCSRGWLAAVLTLVVLCAPVAVSFAGAGPASPGKRTVPPTEAGTVNIQILGVNDLHGTLEPPYSVDVQMVGGVATLAAHIEKREEKNPNGTILAHAGDMVGGSPMISSYFHDEPTVRAMNLMDFDVGTLGNHELDEGKEEMLRLVHGGQRGPEQPTDISRADGPSAPDFAGADFPYLAANTLETETGEPVLPPYRVVERRGVKVGFVGVITPETGEILHPAARPAFRFLDISDTVNRYVPELRGRGVETIVVLAHSGGIPAGSGATGELLDETRQMSGAVDAVIGGHTHQIVKERVKNKLVVEAAEYGTAFGDLDLEVSRATGDVVRSSASVVPTYNDAAPEPRLHSLTAEYGKKVAPISHRPTATAAENVSTASDRSGESELGNLIADAQRSFADADLAFVAPGGLRADIQRGKVTYGELYTTQPFGMDLVKMELTGAQVAKLLEQQFSDGGERILQVSGLRYSYDPSKSAGKRVSSLSLASGAPLEPDTTYSVAANGFLAAGGSEFSAFEKGRDRRVVGGDLESLATYLKGSPRAFSAPDPEHARRISLKLRAEESSS